MKRIDYKDIDDLKAKYLDALQNWRDKHQQEWSNLRMTVPDLQVFPDLLSEILIAKIETLVIWYYQYDSLNINDDAIDKIKTIFKYKGQNQSRISGFFMDLSEKIEIGTCHYCETAYINSYQSGKRKKNHFDIDHYLPKSVCPITALSLFNLVPSCPICNERLKKNRIMGNTVAETIKLCPTSESYNFDELVSVCVMPIEAYHSIHYQDNPEKFKVQFVSSSKEYEEEINVFKLNERYDFHKCEALRLMDMKQNYPDSNIEMIATILGKNKKMVHEDIFGNCFTEQNRRVFSKMYRDIINLQEI